MIPLHDDNPTRILPIVTVAILIACVLAFLWQLLHAPQAQELLITSLGVIPAALLGDFRPAQPLYSLPPSVTLVTSMFLHGGWMHLIGNMLYLWIFGNNVEDAMGHGRFLVFYLLCGGGAALTQAFAAPDSTIPMIGASGAISGILGAYLLLYPHARVLVLLPLGVFTRLVRLPALAVLGFWFVLQVVNSLLVTTGGGGIAWGAHIGGFVAGLALIPLFKHRDVRLFHPGNR
ncbi:MAG: rhomboid family intramembrane serine protease [Candidatus Muproteobacteria bacterium RBG_16_64_11]|uniref:Rhomboid family intramembrane serine protease n=1 Tax=Candidatus Muproteobacteria bacterium RBG_16_64_11 TaxID=1817758 RepID=A0A1F6TA26_9PROT|nr:MAG: rhomboid family intramembrane serine protease [Candidatus Muproteobacteria bacterium RBG_16_64_11]